MTRSDTRGMLYTTPPTEGAEWPEGESTVDPTDAVVHEESDTDSTAQQPAPADD